MKNIAFYWGNIPNPLFGGIDRVTCVWAKAFTAKGYNVFLIYTGGEERALPSMFIKKFKWESPERDYESLRSFFVANNIELCINQRAYDHNIIKQLKKATLLNNCRIISVLHNKPGFEFYCRPGVWGLKKQLWCLVNKKNIYRHYNELVQYSDKVVVLSESYIKLFIDIYKISEHSKLISIPNPLSFDIEQIDYLEKKNILLVVARLDEQQKRISLILRAWKRICEKNEWKLIIVGDGPNRLEYETYVKTREIKNVIFTGSQDPKSFYRISKIFLMTSSYEGWGLTILEAMQFGVVPIVMDSCSVFHDIIVPGNNGLLIENNNLEKYTKGIEYLIKNESLLEKMSGNAIRSSKKYTPEMLLNKWLEL